MTTNTGAVKEDKWAFGFESGYPEMGAWEHSHSGLSMSEQIELGVRICIEKNKGPGVLADTLRNPNEPSRYVLQQPFHALFKDTAKKLYDNLFAFNSETQEEKKLAITESVKKEINENFPPEFLDGLAHFYKSHMSKPGRDTEELKQKAKMEFIRLIMFQFVMSEVNLIANNDPEKMRVVSTQFAKLYQSGAFNGVITLLDQRIEDYQPLPPINETLKNKVEQTREEAYAKLPALKEEQANIKAQVLALQRALNQPEFRDIAQANISRIQMLVGRVDSCFNPQILQKYLDEIMEETVKALQNNQVANHYKFETLPLNTLNILAAKGQLSVLNAEGKTRLEALRESGVFTQDQMTTLLQTANQVKVSISLDDPEQRAVMRLAAQQLHSDEYFLFDDEINRIDKLISENEKIAAIKQLSSDIFEYRGLMSESTPTINLFGSGTPESIEKLGRELQTMVGKPIKVDETNYAEVYEKFKAIDSEYKNLYFDKSMLPEGTEYVMPMLEQPNPLHALVASGKLKSPVNTEILQTCDLNKKNPEGLTVLQLAQKLGKTEIIPDLIKAGANPNLKTTNYERKGLTRFTDTVKGLFSGKGLTFWNKNPERSVKEIAEISGDKVLLQSINLAEQQRKETNEEKGRQVDPSIISSLDSSLPPRVSQSNATELSSRPPSITPLLNDQITQELPKNATPLQAFQHDVRGMQREVKKAIESAEKDDPQSARLLSIDANALKSISELLASPKMNRETLFKDIENVMRGAGEKRKEANHGYILPAESTMKIMDMLEKHQGKISMPVVPETESKQTAKLK